MNRNPDPNVEPGDDLADHLTNSDRESIKRHVAYLHSETCLTSCDAVLPHFGIARIFRDGTVTLPEYLNARAARHLEVA